jgi:hypothetical protein
VLAWNVDLLSDQGGTWSNLTHVRKQRVVVVYKPLQLLLWFGVGVGVRGLGLGVWGLGLGVYTWLSGD